MPNKHLQVTRKGVGSYLLLNTIFHWLYSVVLPIVFCAKSIVIFVPFIVLSPRKGIAYSNDRRVALISQQIERVSIECRKTKTKVITSANQKRRRQSGKPIKTRSNYT